MLSHPTELLTNATFWALLILLCTVVGVRIRHGGTSQALQSALAAMRKVAASSLFLVCLGAGAVSLAALATYMNYVDPWDIRPDIVSAEEVLQGRSMYPRNLTPLMRTTLQNAPPAVSLGSIWPALGAKERREVGGELPSQGHPPLLILAYVPLVALMGVHGSALAADLLSLAMYGLMLFMILRGLGLRLHGRLVLALALAGLAWQPVLNLLRQGQSGLVIALLTTLGWFFLTREQWIPAGIAIGAATCLRIYPAVLLLYLLLRYRKAFAASVVTIVVLTALPVAALGWTPFADYVESARAIVADFGDYPLNISLPALVNKAGIHGSLGIPLILGVMLIGPAAWLISKEKNRKPDAEKTSLEYSLFVTMALLLSPVSWSHYLPVLFLPFMALARRVLGPGAEWKAVLPFLTFLLLLAIPIDALVFSLGRRDPANIHLIGAVLPNCVLLGFWIWMFSLYARRAGY